MSGGVFDGFIKAMHDLADALTEAMTAFVDVIVAMLDGAAALVGRALERYTEPQAVNAGGLALRRRRRSLSP